MILVSQPLPTSRPKAFLTAFVLALIVLGLTMDRELNVFDEGIVLSNAMRIRSGDVVHRDFYSSYGPGAYYIVAGLFALSSAEFAIARGYGLVVAAMIVTMVATILHDRARPIVVAGCAATCAFVLMVSKSYLYPLFPCLLLALCSSALLVRADAVHRSPRLLLVGACAGLAAYFRYDTGFILLVANVLAIATLLAFDRKRSWWIESGRAALICGLGAGVVFVPGALAYLLTSPLSAFVDDIVAYGFEHYVAMRSLPFPGFMAMRTAPTEAYVYLPVVAVAATFAELWHRRAKRETPADRERFSLLIVFGVLTLIMYYKGIVRVSTLHMLTSIVPALILLGFCASAWWGRRSQTRPMAMMACLVIAMPAVAAMPMELKAFLYNPTRTMGGWAVISRGASGQDPDRPCNQRIELWPARQPMRYSAIAYYLRLNSAPGERILVALDRHDRIYANPLSLYFSTDRLPATHWHQFDPGLQTRRDIQSAMVKELTSKKTRWVVRDGSFDGANEPNQSSMSSGVLDLDRYLDTHYRKVAWVGKTTLWLENSFPIPAPMNGVEQSCRLQMAAVAEH